MLVGGNDSSTTSLPALEGLGHLIYGAQVTTVGQVATNYGAQSLRCARSSVLSPCRPMS